MEGKERKVKLPKGVLSVGKLRQMWEKREKEGEEEKEGKMKGSAKKEGKMQGLPVLWEEAHLRRWGRKKEKEEGWKAGKWPVGRPESRVPGGVISQLEGAGVIEAAGRGKIGAFFKLFLIEKGEEEWRTICDLRPLNASHPPPPKVTLLGVEEVARRLLRGKERWGRKVDLRGFFHQFPVPPHLTRVFGVWAQGRSWGWARLPMGWAWAPCVAQETAVLMGGEPTPGGESFSLCHIDDICVVAETEEGTEERDKEVRGRIEELEGEINEEKSGKKASQCIEHVGVEWDLKGKRMRLRRKWAKEWAECLVRQLQSEKVKRGEIWSVLGGLCWFLRVRQEAWGKWPKLHKRLREEGKETDKEEWSEWTREERRELAEAASEMVENKWKGWRPDWERLEPGHHAPPTARRPTWVVASDASQWGWGVVAWEVGRRGVRREWGVWKHPHEPGEMYCLEALAAGRAIDRVARWCDQMGGAGRRAHSVLLVVDNQGVCESIRRGRSRVEWVCGALGMLWRRLETFEAWGVTWVKSEQNPADEPSRKLTKGEDVTEGEPPGILQELAEGGGWIW